MRFFVVLVLLMVSLAAYAQAEEKPMPRHHLPFVYYLQNINFYYLTQINPAVAVVDPYDSGLKKKDISYLQKKYGQTILGYLSAGEVDPSRKGTYDGYAFREEWKKQQWYVGVPKEAKNNEMWGTQRVEYWHPEWRAILAYRVKRLIESGYDGVMLDTVDTFYAFKDRYKRDVKQEMANLVGYLRDIAHEINPDFLIYINGGMELYDTSYTKTGEPFLDVIHGQLKEDTWYNERGAIMEDWTDDDIAFLARAIKAGKPVFTIDYFTNEKSHTPDKRRMNDFMLQSRKLGAIPYAADRDLGKYLEYNTDYYKNEFNWDTAKKAGLFPSPIAE